MQKVCIKMIGIALPVFVAVGGGFLLANQSAGAIDRNITKSVNAQLASNISLSLPEEFVLDVTPSANPQLKTASGVISVSTNNSTGYNLTLEVDNTVTNNLVHSQSVDYTIKNLEANTTAATFPVNRWGYSLDAPSSLSSFSPLPAIGNMATLSSSEGPTVLDNVNFSIGTKLNTETVGGEYTNRLKFTAVTNYAPPPGISFDKAYRQAGKTKITGSDGKQYYKMQDMDSSICDAVSLPTSKDEADTQLVTLIDVRDGKTYTVAKFLDGNCWMTQNLDLDLNSSKPLTPDDSNISANWTPQTTFAESEISRWDSGATATNLNSIDSGNYYYDGVTHVNCGSSAKSFGACTGFNSTGNKHYYVGNMYSWNAVTAGTGGTITSKTATDSICPKGWKLPTSNTSANGSFKALVDAYSIGSNTQAIIDAPFYMVRGGYLQQGGMTNPGYDGYYWSSMAYSNTDFARALYFTSTNSVSPNGEAKRAFGVFVRCLAQ